MKYTVVIEKRHCENTTYGSCTDCALARAIKEQHPNLKLGLVGGCSVIINDVNCQIPICEWNPTTFDELRNGIIISCRIKIDVPLQQDAYKEVENLKPKIIYRSVEIDKEVNKFLKEQICES